MTADLLALMWMPFLMCLVLTGIHAYLGFHVIAREVVFVDIALAQIAALGATAAFLVGYELETWQSYAAGLGFTILGALVLALTRSRRRPGLARGGDRRGLRGLRGRRGAAGRPLAARRRAPARDAGGQPAQRARRGGAQGRRALRADRRLSLALPPAVLPHLHRSRPRLSRWLARPRVGLSLLRLVRRRRDLVGAHRGRPARLLVPDRPRARGHPARPAHRSAGSRWAGPSARS